MNTGNPPERVIKIIADMIGGGRLCVSSSAMFSVERFNGAFQQLAISIMARTDCSDVFFIMLEL